MAYFGSYFGIPSSGGGGGPIDIEAIREAVWGSPEGLQSQQAANRILAVPGEPDTPLDLIPAYTAPTGLIRVLLRPTKMKQLVDRAAQVFYVDQVPLVDESIEMVKEGSSFEKNADVFGPTYAGLIMPVGESVFRSSIEMAGMTSQEKRARFQVVDLHGDGVVFLDELINAYLAAP